MGLNMQYIRQGSEKPMDNKQEILGTIEESIMSSMAKMARDGACLGALLECRVLISGLAASLWSVIVLSIDVGNGNKEAQEMLDQMDTQINEHLQLIHKIAVGFAEGNHKGTVQ